MDEVRFLFFCTDGLDTDDKIVGFTGSGQAMRKDPTRSRHVYQPTEDYD